MRILPLTFSEMKKNIYKNIDNQQCLNKYIKFGSMGKIIPYYENENQMIANLQKIYEDCLQRDLIKKYKIRNILEFEKISNYLYSTIGCVFSSQNVVTSMRKNGSTLIVKTVDRYLKWFCEANLFIKVPYFDIRGKRLLKTSCKYYSTDLGISSFKNNFIDSNFGYRIENLVLLELFHRYDKVFTFKNKITDVDFIAFKNGIWTYIQVTQYLFDKSESISNWDREVGNLEHIRDMNKTL